MNTMEILALLFFINRLVSTLTAKIAAEYLRAGKKRFSTDFAPAGFVNLELLKQQGWQLMTITDS